jgi:hypothetical protein
MRDLIQIGLLGLSTLIAVVSVFAIWLVPVIIALITGNWYLLFTYAVWWIPAIVLTSIVSVIYEAVLEITF